MKRILILLMILACLCATGCSSENTTELTSAPTESTEFWLPRGLEGNWVSATVSDRGYSESITFGADGSLLVESLCNGKVENSIFGSFYVEENQIIFSISNGTSPYKDYFEFRLDGRELYLIDNDGPAHYLRTS